MNNISKIIVLPRRVVLDFLNHCLSKNDKPKYSNWHFISIYSCKRDKILNEFNIDAFKNNGMQLYLSLLFEDITFPGEDVNGDPLILFNESHAQQIIKMLNEIKSYPIKSKLIIHCDAGICRSGAVGVFAAQYFNYNMDKFKKDNPFIHPNKLVLETLERVKNEKIQKVPNQK